MLEGAAQRASDEELLDQNADQTESDFIFDDIPHDGSSDSISNFGGELMPVMKGLKRSGLLDVREVVIPLELNDARNPASAKRQEWQNAK